MWTMFLLFFHNVIDPTFQNRVKRICFMKDVLLSKKFVIKETMEVKSNAQFD